MEPHKWHRPFRVHTAPTSVWYPTALPRNSIPYSRHYAKYVIYWTVIHSVFCLTMGGPEGSRRFRLPDFHGIRHMKVMRSSPSRPGRLYPQEIFLVLIFTKGWVDLRAMVRSEGNMSLKNPVTPPGIDPRTVRLVAQRLNHYATPDSHLHGTLQKNYNITVTYTL